MEKKLFLLDAYALIYRSYYAFIKNPRINSKGLNTSAVFGFTLTLEEILKKEKPSHIAVVFDPPSPTFRHHQYPEYKANRPPMPEDLRAAVPYIRQIIEAFQVAALEVDQYEADDVVGTIARQAAAEGFEVFMMTPDKDYGQLITEQVKMYRPRRSGQEVEIIDKARICEENQIRDPAQIIDILALWGDTADNIPGCPGIGEKGSKKLISTYGTIDNLYTHINDLKGKQKENLLAFKDQIEMARKLVTIDVHAPIDFDEQTLRWSAPDMKKLTALFEELEFRALSQRIQADFQHPVSSVSGSGAPQGTAVQGSLFDSPEPAPTRSPADELNTLETVVHRYTLTDQDEDIRALVRTLGKTAEFCFDTETTGIDALEAELVGLALSWNEHHATYVPFPADPAQAQARLELFRPVFEHPGIRKIGQNLKYDIQIIQRYGLTVKGELFDTMIAHYLIDADGRHNLDSLARNYLSYKMIPISDLIGEKGKQQKSMRDLPPALVKDYACEDADITFQLKRILLAELKDKDLLRVFQEVEVPLIPVLARMEKDGIRMDPSSLGEFADMLRDDILRLEKEITDEAGVQFNVGSPKQLGEVLFDHLKIDPQAKKTRSKQYSTSEEVLSKLEGKHPIVSKVLEYRGLRKLLNTYVETLPGLVHPKTGKIHTSFNQTVAATGRLSSINPNLQNIPIREARGREIRKTFVPTDDDHLFLSADYSQVELRLMAHLSGDENMIAAFNRNEDIHAATAALIHNVRLDQVTREMRTQAKTANFGIIYGISSFGLSQRLNIPRREARQLIEGYFRSYPKIREYMDRCIEDARTLGYVTTLYGRKRYLPDIHSNNQIVRGNAERNAINAPVQGSAADLIKIAMIRIFEAFGKHGLQSKMILQVHDELNFDVRINELDQVRELVRYEMEHVYQLNVPLVVDMGTGNNWFEAH